MTQTAAHAIEQLRDAFTPIANPERAFAMARTMRDQFSFFGIKAKPRRAAQHDVEQAIAEEPIDLVLDFCHKCWAQEEREFQHTACDLLRRTATRLQPEHLDAIKKLIVTKSWWDTVDPLAGRTVGPLVKQHELSAEMDRWIDDDNLWVARTAILHQLFWKHDTDEARLFDYCEKQLHHKDFFIRKAIGWALRHYARTDPDAVLAFVDQHGDQMSGLSKREALRHIG